jgi:hypothetical protein
LSGERDEEKRKDEERQIQQINGVIAGIGFTRISSSHRRRQYNTAF